MKLTSLSILVGTGDCNANCGFCAGKPLRQYAPKEDGVVNGSLVSKTLRDCHESGARSLSLSSCGEPTLSPLAVTKTLELINKAATEGFRYSPINLYSNGIRIGQDEDFCSKHLPNWKDLGLTTVYVTVHDTDEKNNARVYRTEKYPDLNLIFSRIHNANLLIRANLVLSKRAVGTFEKFISSISHLKAIGADSISAWPLRNLDDTIDLGLSPSEEELERMKEWSDRNKQVRFIYQKIPGWYELNNKLTLFPDGTLAYSWARREDTCE